MSKKKKKDVVRITEYSFKRAPGPHAVIRYARYASPGHCLFWLYCPTNDFGVATRLKTKF